MKVLSCESYDVLFKLKMCCVFISLCDLLHDTTLLLPFLTSHSLELACFRLTVMELFETLRGLCLGVCLEYTGTES